MFAWCFISEDWLFSARASFLYSIWGEVWVKILYKWWLSCLDKFIVGRLAVWFQGRPSAVGVCAGRAGAEGTHRWRGREWRCRSGRWPACPYSISRCSWGLGCCSADRQTELPPHRYGSTVPRVPRIPSCHGLKPEKHMEQQEVSLSSKREWSCYLKVTANAFLNWRQFLQLATQG